MAKEKSVRLEIDVPTPTLCTSSNGDTKGVVYNGGLLPLGLPQPLLLEEKKFLLAVERGDIANVRRIIQKAHKRKHININCMDPLGRRALTLAIDNENLEMVELLILIGVETNDALLHAINAEFVEAVELLLEHEELIYTEGELYSWQKVDINTAMFAPDITPLILAAHKNNFEILKLLLDRGAAVPVPHDIRCGCEECVRQSTEDSLQHSLSRVNIYRALTSPSLICLTSTDPILTAFQLSWELRTLAHTEPECKAQYLELRRQCQQFAVDLLDQTRTSQELAIILNYDPQMSTYVPGDRMTLARLEQAITFKQKKFVAHSNIQQLLTAIWYEGLPGFRRKTLLRKVLNIVQVALLFPIYCIIYMIAPNCSTGKLMRKPFMKFLIHASSYLFFLFILIMVSQRADDDVIRILGTDSMRKTLDESMRRQRGNGPTKLELIVFMYLLGFLWEEVHEIFIVGMRNYLRNMWNFIDFLRNSLYISVVCLRTYAYMQQMAEIEKNPRMAFVPREDWTDFDPQLIAEGLFAAANIFSALKMVHLFSINPHLGPLQISLGRMVIDIVKFFSIYTLVLFAFACGLNQLLWYFADLEKKKCYVLPENEADWNSSGDSCLKWRRFGNLFESSQSLFWASFGMVGLDSFELTGIKSYTRFWGLLIFGSYCVINVIVLLNLLIAMMSNSYAAIDQQSDTEWKFARTKLWMSYFEDSSTLPPPFNVLPSTKWLIRLFRRSTKEIARKTSEKRHEQEKENRYISIMRALVWRYVSGQHRKFEEAPVTEDDVNEVKSEISTMRYELLEIFNNNGLDISSAAKKEKPCRAKRTKIWERRLMRDFHVAPIPSQNTAGSPSEEGNTDASTRNINGQGDVNEIKVESDIPSPINKDEPPPYEDPKSRFRRIARLVASQSIAHKWNFVLQGVAKNSQIGRCCSMESYKNLQHLEKAIKETKKLILLSPKSQSGRESPTIEFQDERRSTLLELLDKISEELGESSGSVISAKAKKAHAIAGKANSNYEFLACGSKTSPANRLPKDIDAVIKEHGFMSPSSTNRFDAGKSMSAGAAVASSSWISTATMESSSLQQLRKKRLPPEIQLTKTPQPIASAIAGTTEMILTVSNLDQQSQHSKQVPLSPPPLATKATKKAPAPQRPTGCSSLFSSGAEVGQTRRYPSATASTKPPMLGMMSPRRTAYSSDTADTSTRSLTKESFDITFLDLNDSTEQLFASGARGSGRPESPDASEVSSISTMTRSPRAPAGIGGQRDVSSDGKSWL